MSGFSALARAEIAVAINKSQQSMTVSINGTPTYHWAVSTGRPGYDTPSGSFTAERLAKVYFSKKYDDAPMPNSVFFYEGFAIHGTYEQRRLGSPASHGCVRLSRANAATLFALVSAQGLSNTHVVVSDGPAGMPMATLRRRNIESAYTDDGRRARREARARERYEARRALPQEAQARPDASFERVFRETSGDNFR
ncbi:MAG: L,D-transpeptidase [Pseudolabrys sp.]